MRVLTVTKMLQSILGKKKTLWSYLKLTEVLRNLKMSDVDARASVLFLEISSPKKSLYRLIIYL